MLLSHKDKMLLKNHHPHKRSNDLTEKLQKQQLPNSGSNRLPAEVRAWHSLETRCRYKCVKAAVLGEGLMLGMDLGYTYRRSELPETLEPLRTQSSNIKVRWGPLAVLFAPFGVA